MKDDREPLMRSVCERGSLIRVRFKICRIFTAPVSFFFLFSSRLSRELRNSIENPRLYWNGTKRLFVPFISFRRVKKVTTHNINERKVPNPQLQRILRTPGREEKKRNGHQRMKRCDGCVLSLTRRISACCRRPPERINRPTKKIKK